MESKNIFLFAIFFILGAALCYGALMIFNKPVLSTTSTNNPNIPVTTIGTNPALVDNSPIKQFSTYADFKNFLKKAITSNSDTSGAGGGGSRSNGMMAEQMVAGATDAVSKSAPSASSQPASQYSHTNVQVEGVDEPDIMKNDGKYIYTLSGNRIKIIDAFPANEMNIVGEIKYENNVEDYNKPYITKYARNIFINENKLVVFLAESSYTPYTSIRCLGLYYCGGNYESYSDIYIYDITDKTNPKLEQNYSIKGDYTDARMIKDYVYLISKQYANPDEPEIPYYYHNGVLKEIGLNHVYFFDYVDSSYYLTSVSALNVKTGDFNSNAYLTGYTSVIYSSENNIYITSTEYMNNDEYQKSIIKEAVLPIISDEPKQKINEILNSDSYEYSKWKKIGIIVEDYYNKLPDDEKINFNKTLFDNLYNVKSSLEKEREKTVVHKISIDKDKIDYKTSAKVPGHLLNQFSMDENNGYFRIATTVGQRWWWGWSWSGIAFNSSNGVYVLDSDMKTVGSVEGLASGETIYSTRFLGDKAYLVTYRQIDPLFVIDLKSPTNPKVLGYLKVAGVSNYLHPYDENHIIGFGTDATEEGRQKGMKISIFDVSDFNNPKETAKYLIGDRGTTSPILYDHKALLFDKEKNLLVIPVLVYEINPEAYKNQPGGVPSWAYGEQSWQGAYIFNINSDELTLKGKITHFSTYVPSLEPAKEEAIGAIRIDYSGNSYKKTGDNQWTAQNANYYYYNYFYQDYQIDEFPGGVGYKPNFYDQRYTIERSLFMDNTLYTVSNTKVMANKLDNLDEIKSVDLGFVDNQNYYSYYF